MHTVNMTLYMSDQQDQSCDPSGSQSATIKLL